MKRKLILIALLLAVCWLSTTAKEQPTHNGQLLHTLLTMSSLTSHGKSAATTTFHSKNKKWFDKKATSALNQLYELMPEVYNDVTMQQKTTSEDEAEFTVANNEFNDIDDEDFVPKKPQKKAKQPSVTEDTPSTTTSYSSILATLFNTVRRLITGELKAVRALKNVQYLDQIHTALQEQPALIAIVQNTVRSTSSSSAYQQYKLRNSTLEPIIKYSSVDASMQQNSRYKPAKYRFLETTLIPRMNQLALEFETRAKYMKQANQTTPLFGTFTIRVLPEELAKNSLVAVYSITTGNLFIHPYFFEIMNTINEDEDATFKGEKSAELLQRAFNSMRDLLPERIVSMETVYLILSQVPALLFSSQFFVGMSITCMACLAGLCVLTPFILNYSLFELATYLCTTLDLEQQVCISVELGSLLLAYVMIFPASLVIFYMCKKFVCATAGRFIYRFW